MERQGWEEKEYSGIFPDLEDQSHPSYFFRGRGMTGGEEKSNIQLTNISSYHLPDTWIDTNWMNQSKGIALKELTV